uniref:WAT1-related protein n=1 Tax=Kalanchoe fedtschenkoi TaxID=63787 RepID=A0A7N0ZZD4_KALFE
MCFSNWLVHVKPTIACCIFGVSTAATERASEQSRHVARDEPFRVHHELERPQHYLPPPCTFFSRRISRPPITFLILGKLFILGLVRTTLLQNFMFTGINYSSPTLSSAMTNVQPALTFVLAVIFRMEKVDIGCFRSQIKILGTVVSVSGALTMTLYKGPALWTSLPANPQLHNLLPGDSNWVFGGFCFAIVALSTATCSILQAWIMREYPSEIAVVMFYCLFGTIQCAVVSSIVERDLDAWKLGPDIELAARV